MMNSDSSKKNMPQAPEALQAPEPAVRFDLPIDEFCVRLKGNGVSQMLADAFKADQISIKKVKADEAYYQAAFDQFKVRPV